MAVPLITKGRYSQVTIRPRDDLIIKRVRRPQCESPEDLEQTLLDRAQSVRLYYARLREVFVNVPTTQVEVVETEDGLSQLEIRQTYVEGDNALQCAAQLDATKMELLITDCCKETLKVVATMFSDRPIGYDVGYHNFVVPRFGHQVFAVDLYPPRLAYKINGKGQNVRIHQDKLFVCYPEGHHNGTTGNFVVKNRAQSDYTALGILQNFLAWSIGAFYAKEQTVLNWSDISARTETKRFIDLVVECVRSANITEETERLVRSVNSEYFIKLMGVRLSKGHEKLRALVRAGVED
ncbi:hypothetical protein A2291_02755 [candidate division WOR-1 bacterium RIFOXYB2_FULL_42_35]|uniref:Uncharacterized protein n=1 Tax=candidate division WOR-1 bacterium RIFOXYC2_FULL_41_25 TaxID=1802586 RepID=A0A1F4TMK7_UNCSA|nr:MAG: hypothetical protein A2247_04885 [candidate division WOR-1 bacterium RIFOXYA2_FULL_41_14]OGC23114.1 MAG: hypothetical protein A2291_02755 [candidate division WOR-1 bacterium RIFOXYB2_FULL_42_35]OGC33961.1 MAG: hypothetical protein A2462_07590 [candidate division WOR-1 bacterium RIFOXYC2_FULL_41_25]OGC42057.1 MAG: hypothetical protein A2548_04235 [candidate division WOR-1 bacterium RIFOXYD2_FULL_41_8]